MSEKQPEYTYRVARAYGNEPSPIERLEVVKRTACTITTIKKHRSSGREERENYTSTYYKHYPSFEEARQAQMRSCRRLIEQAKSTIIKCQNRLDQLESYGLTPVDTEEQ